MRTYDLRQRGRTPLYIYLYMCIRQDIEQHIISAGEKLPSKRALAEHLHISVITVQNAYAQLLAEGYITSRERGGYFAAALDAPPELPLSDPPPRPRAEAPRFPMDFCENSIPPGSFPFSVWARQMREVLADQGDELLQRCPSTGMEALRRAIAGFLRRWRGMDVTAEQIVVGAGTDYLYTLLAKLLGRDSVYALEDPGYRQIAAIYQSEGAVWLPVPLDAAGMSAGALRSSGANVAHISPSHHFPTGIVMPISRRQEILRWAAEAENRYIIEDDYDSEFRFSGRALPTLQSIDSNEKVIYVNTFSKTLAPSIRISYMVLPPHLLHRYRQRLDFFACPVPSFEQAALARFIEQGYFERHISRMRKYYKGKRDAIISAVRSSPPGRVARIREENAGLHFILKLRTSLSDAALTAWAAQRGIRISCLSQYYFSEVPEDSRGCLLINYSGIDTSQALRAVELLSQIP